VTEGSQQRKNIRLVGYNYSQAGYYFITICTCDREKIFGDIINDEMTFSKLGMIAHRNLNYISEHIDNVYVDKFIVMPNHIHLILVVDSICDMKKDTIYGVLTKTQKEELKI